MPEELIILDLFCGAGGATKGYQNAGFKTIGIDIDPQPNYCGDQFLQADISNMFVKDNKLYITKLLFIELKDLTAIHASPPCQAYSDLQKQNKREYPELLEFTRALLQEMQLPYIIENVEGAPLIDPITLCGTMFPNLRVIRHRLFESNIPLTAPETHPKHPLVYTLDKRKAHYGKLDQDTSFVQVTGGGNCSVKNKLNAMNINWMNGKEVNQAIPPDYTEYLGKQLLAHVKRETL